MFPLTSNEPYIKPTGERSTLGAVLGGGSYTLPTAGADTKGGVKIGTGLKMTGEVLSANQVPAHTIAEAGKVLTVADDGSLEWDTKGSGGGDAFLSYDFTKFGNVTITGVEMSSNGAEFANVLDYFEIVSKDYKRSDITIYVDTGAFVIVSGSVHQRFVVTKQNANSGLIWRYTDGTWSIYDGSAWCESEISDTSFFNNCTFKIYIDANNYWHVYKNNALVLESAGAITDQVNTPITLGSVNGQSISQGIIKAVRVYNGNYTE